MKSSAKIPAACLAVALLATTVPVRGQTSVTGQWSAVVSMPLVAVHAAIMPAGRLLLFDAWEIPGTPSARLWDPATNTYSSVPNGFAELFCAGHVLTPNGRLLTSGGHNGAGVGTPDATYFDPTTLLWTALPNLQYARWYPSVTPLADGRTLTLGGAISRPNIAEVPEVLAANGLSWTPMPGAQKDVGEYPQAYQGPDGRVFVSAADATMQSWLLNVSTSNWTPLGQGPAAAGTGVMYRPGKIMMTSGGTLGVDPVTRATGVIDLNAATPSWRSTAPMAFGRSQHNLVLLPDGKVLVVGGAAEVSLISTNGVLPAEIWDPVTETWTQVASMARPRMYHSIAILLPDGRVFAAGGGRINPAVTDQLNGEFYSPPYLFNGPRPVVTSAPGSVNYGASFNVALPNPAAAARVTFVRASSVTHGINLDQRFFELSFTAGAGALTVTAPNDTRLAPAGDYFLYVLDANGVPSLGRVVRLGGTPSTPTLVIGDVSVNEGTAAANNAVFSVTLNGTSAQTVTVNYATSNGTALAGTDYSSRSGTLSFPPGTTSLTVSVPTVADAMPESNETFSVVLSGAANATIGDATAIGTIIDDDAPAASALSVNSVSVPEGSSGTPVAAFSVTLSPASAQNVLVSYRTLPGTATSPADFTSTTGTLTFAGGTTVQTVQVPIVPDQLVEANETFTLELYNPVNATFNTSQGTATIVDDDSGTVTATYVVALGENDVTEDGGTLTTDAGQVWLGTGASAAASYLGLRFTGVAIPAGATVTAAHLDVNAAATQWNAVGFELGAEAAANSAPFSASSRPSQRTLLAPRVTHASDVQWVTGTRYSLDDIRTLVQAAVQQPGWAGQTLTIIARGTGSAWARKFISAAESGAANAPRLVVTYTGGGGGPVNQPPVITLASGTPTSGTAPLAVNFSGAATDPEGAPLTYTWLFGDGGQASGATASHSYAAGSYSATLRVSDGTNTVTSAPVNIQATTATLPALSVSDVTVTEGQSGTTVASFTVSRTAGGSTVTASYATANGTAVAPGDYTTTSGTVTLTGPTLSTTVTVPVVGDTSVEPNETFSLVLSNPVGATIADGTGVATIVNDDGGGGGPVTATYTIASGGDDVNEEGTSFVPDSALWVGNGSSTTASFLGLRFTGVTIPAGATVTAARLEFVATATQWNTVSFEFAAEAAGNSAAFTTTSRPSGRTLLVPRVTHASDAQWVSGTRYTLEDISAIVQAAVNQPAWAGQALSVIVRGTGNAWARKFISAAESGAANAPRLVVTYTGGGGGPVNQPPVITLASGTPTSGTAPLAVNFSGAATDPEGAPLTYTWLFGDGGQAGGATASHAYAAGTWSATLRVSDGTNTVTSTPVNIQATTATLPALSVSDVTVTEGQSGTTVASFTVSRTAGGSTVTASYATANGTAVAPGDYTTTSGTVTLTGPTLSTTVTVPVVGDTSVEPNETFSLVLSNPVGATIADGTGVATIVNDDGGGGGPVTATYTIASGGDDVNEEGTSFVPDSALWVGNGSSTTASFLGLRFTGVTIPAGATVTAARLEFVATATQWNTVAFEFAAEASGNSAAFSTASRPSGRTLLVPRVTHASDAQWVSGTRYALEDISAIVQAAVNQPAWAAGQALSVIVRGTGGAWARKFISAAESGAANAPRLVVTYTTP